jgi:hypothetical protein
MEIVVGHDIVALPFEVNASTPTRMKPFKVEAVNKGLKGFGRPNNDRVRSR